MELSKKPIRHSNHIKEDISKRAFEEIIEPFFVQNWTIRDYGIDALVEITSLPEKHGDVIVESKCFMVQLKSTDKQKETKEDISFILPVIKIQSWLSYNLPVLFVLYNISEKTFLHTWIDESLKEKLNLKNRNWVNQQSVTIKLSKSSRLTKNHLPHFKKYVLEWRIPYRRQLSPGVYFKLQEKSIALTDQYKQISQIFNFQSIEETILKLKNDLKFSIYKVAVTGSSRVGKSTIINKLLKREVSPTGFFQTTGVPIQFLPGNCNEIEVFFSDKPSQKMNFNMNAITKYASQEFNEDNILNVTLVSVYLDNEDLESGISVFDVPGNDDPNDAIQQYTWMTINSVNAIIYVIDSSSFEDGGYIFRSEYKKNIQHLGQTQDKVFLVFNKVDKLSPVTLEKLKVKVKLDLIKYEVDKIIDNKIYYLSAEKVTGKCDCNTIENLRDDLWLYILGNSKSGIARLGLRNSEMAISLKVFSEILNARLLDSEKCMELEKSISELKKCIPDFREIVRKKQSSAREFLIQWISNYYHKILTDLEAELKQIPINESLPNSMEIKTKILKKLNLTLEEGNKQLLAKSSEIKVMTDYWIENNLKQIRLILSDAKSHSIEFNEIESFEVPQIDLSSSVGMGIIGMTTAYFFAPAFILTAGLIGFLGNLFTNVENRRIKQISRIMDNVKLKYSLSFKKIKDAYNELFDQHVNFLTNYFDHNVNHYISDLQLQISKFNKPLSEKEKKEFAKAHFEAKAFNDKLLDFEAELRSFSFKT